MTKLNWDKLKEENKRTLLESINTEDHPLFAILADSYSTTQSTLKTAWKHFTNNPTFTGTGPVVKTGLGGTDANYFTLQAKSISFIDAICEILDGIIENHANHKDSKKVTNVSFVLTGDGKNKEMILEENSGGIMQDNLDSIATLGDSGWGSLYGVGVFGVGLKKGLRKISRHHEIFTWNQTDSKPVEMQFSEQFWEDVGTTKTLTQATECVGHSLKIMKNKKGTTFIHFKKFEQYDEELEFNENFVSEIARYYHQWLDKVMGEIHISFKHGSAPEIWLKNHKVDLFSDTKIQKEFTYHPAFEPRQFTYTYISDTKRIDKNSGKEVDSKVTINLKFGLTRKSEEATAGVYVYGNDRFFHGPNRDMKFGFGDTGHFGTIKPFHAETKRFRAKVDVYAESPIDIPWNVGEKNGYNQSAPAHHWISRMISCAAHTYMAFDHDTKIPQTQYFSINGIDTSTPDYETAFFPVDNPSSPTGQNAKKKIEDFVPRNDLMKTPIDFSNIGNPGDSYGTWQLEEMKLTRDICKKKKQSNMDGGGQYPDSAFIDHLFSMYQPPPPTPPTPPSTPKSSTKSSPKTPKSTTKKTATTTLSATSTAKLKAGKKVIIHKRNTNLQASLPTAALDTLWKESGLDKTDKRASVVKLWCHYMLTKDSFNSSNMPSDGSNTQESNQNFSKWVSDKKWVKKKTNKKAKKNSGKKKPAKK